MAPFPENSSIFSYVLYTYNVCTCCTSSSHNEAAVHRGWHRLYLIYACLCIYISCYTCCVVLLPLIESKFNSVLENPQCPQRCLFLRKCWAISSFWHLLFIDRCPPCLPLHEESGDVTACIQPVVHCTGVWESCIETHRPREIPSCTSWLVFLFNTLPDPAQQEDLLYTEMSKQKTQWRKFNQGETESRKHWKSSWRCNRQIVVGKERTRQRGRLYKINSENRRLRSRVGVNGLNTIRNYTQKVHGAAAGGKKPTMKSL